MYAGAKPSISFQRPTRVSALRLLAALFGAPAAWVAQLSWSEPLAANACYPYQSPLPAPLWPELSVILALISAACLIIGLVSGYIAWSLCRQTHARLLSGEDNDDRSRFLAKLGILSSFIFTMAILFTSCAVLLVSPCSSWF